jgi:hypothetical protein
VEPLDAPFVEGRDMTSAETPSGLTPRKVLLFSGHMIDSPRRKEPRFPPDREASAAKMIVSALDTLDVGARDLAICGGACGGDLLFAEAVLARGARLEIYIPLDEPSFLRESVDFADANWRERYFAAKARSTLHVAPDERGPLPAGEDPFERNNLWMLESALRFGAEKVDFICLWNGKGGDGAGGTKHLMDEVAAKAGEDRVHLIDTTKAWSLP